MTFFQRWAFCFRTNLFNVISTTNGIEHQYKELKHLYLKEFGIGKSLSNVTEVLVKNLFPDAELRFVSIAYADYMDIARKQIHEQI